MAGVTAGPAPPPRRRASAPCPNFLNNELRGGDHDPRDERESATSQQNVDDDGHGTLPIHKAPSHAAALGHSCSLAKRRRWPVQIWAAMQDRGVPLAAPKNKRPRFM